MKGCAAPGGSGNRESVSQASCIILLFILAFVAPAAAKAGEPAFPTGSSASRFLQRVSGITTATDFLTSRIAGALVRRKLSGRVKVRVKTYGLTNLLAGKLKSVKIELADSSYQGVPLGNLTIATQHPVWAAYLKTKTARPGILSPVLITIAGALSQEEISRALAADEISSRLKMVKLDLPGLGSQHLQLLNPAVKLGDNRVEIVSKLQVLGSLPEGAVTVKIACRPRLFERAKIFIDDLTVFCPEIIEPAEFAGFAARLVNPLVDLGRFDRADHAFRLDQLEVTDHTVRFSGSLILAPRRSV